MMDNNDRVDLAPPTFTFKPIDEEGVEDDVSSISSGSSSHDEHDLNPGLPPSAAIFRDGRERSVPVQLAHPIGPGSTSVDYDEVMDEEDAFACRLISPYPFSQASHEEITEREELTNTPIKWILGPEPSSTTTSNTKQELVSVQVNYSSFFADLLGGDVGEIDAAMDECDDFSVSVHDVESLSRDLGLEDPASFWEKGASNIPNSIFIERTKSPTEVSLGSTKESPIFPSLKTTYAE